MKVVCVWCGSELSPGQPGDVVSHGVCEACYHALIVKRKLALSELLDRIDVPVIALDAGVTALLANQAAERAVGKKVDLIKGSLAGDVFECVYASTPEGCGRTIHCSGCTIRRTVLATHQDGQARRGVEVEQLVQHAGERRLTRYRISTEKIFDQVMLIIEDVRMLATDPDAGTVPPGG